jgi:hypothetical protein
MLFVSDEISRVGKTKFVCWFCTCSVLHVEEKMITEMITEMMSRGEAFGEIDHKCGATTQAITKGRIEQHKLNLALSRLIDWRFQVTRPEVAFMFEFRKLQVR